MALERKEALSEFRQRKGREQDLPPPYCLQKIQVLNTKMIQTNNKNGHIWNQSWTAYSSNLSMTGVAGRHPQSRQRIPHCAKCDLLPAKAFHLHACPKSFFPSQSSSSSSAT